jgi:hypothetical protein
VWSILLNSGKDDDLKSLIAGFVRDFIRLGNCGAAGPPADGPFYPGRKPINFRKICVSVAFGTVFR